VILSGSWHGLERYLARRAHVSRPTIRETIPWTDPTADSLNYRIEDLLDYVCWVGGRCSSGGHLLRCRPHVPHLAQSFSRPVMVRLGGGVGLFVLVSDVGRAGGLPATLDG
jgi:hypothetical protein